MKTDKLIFDAETHTYYLDGRELPSVTQLLKKHGLAPDFSGVSSEILKQKAERGTYIHEEIENFIKNGDLGLSDECDFFVRVIAPALKEMQSEVMLCTEEYAGTADILATNLDDKKVIIDTKTGQIHKEAVRWQLSLYQNALGEEYKDALLFVFDAKPNRASQLIKVDPIDPAEIEKLLNAEKSGELYQRPALAIEASVQDKALALEQEIASLETQIKALKSDREKCWEIIKKAMEDQGVKSFETTLLKITYVDPAIVDGIDTKALKESDPEIYEKYYKPTNRKASLRVTVKGA